MLDYLQIEVGLDTHPKTLNLASRLEIHRWAAVGLVTSLWIWTAKNAEDGDLRRWFGPDIMRIIGVIDEFQTETLSTDTEKVWLALIDSGFLDVVTEAEPPEFDANVRCQVHDWKAKYGAVFARREAARERMKKARSRNVPSTFGEHNENEVRTGCEQDVLEVEVEVEQYKDNNKTKPLSPAATPPVLSVLRTWNETASPPIRRARDLTGKRATTARARLAEPGFADAWPEVCRRIAESPFCRGENPRGWTAGIDFAIRPGVWQRVLEGEFDSRHARSRTPAAEKKPALDPEADAAARSVLIDRARERVAAARASQHPSLAQFESQLASLEQSNQGAEHAP